MKTIYVDTSVFGGKFDKEFDYVKSVRKERHRIASDTEGMSASEVLKYFQKRKKENQSSKDPS